MFEQFLNTKDGDVITFQKNRPVNIFDLGQYLFPRPQIYLEKDFSHEYFRKSDIEFCGVISDFLFRKILVIFLNNLAIFS